MLLSKGDAMLGRLWAWAKKDPIPALTIGGVVVYAFLRLPYGVYYGTLGTSPEDVGLSYVETLARSTAGLTVLAAGVGLAAAALGGILSIVGIYSPVLYEMWRARAVGSRGLESMDDDEFGRVVKSVRRMGTFIGFSANPTFEWALEDMAEVRRLRLLGVRDVQQQARLDVILRRHRLRAALPVVVTEIRRIARRTGALGASTALLAIVAGLPLVAYADAIAVKDCDAPWLGRYGLFAIRGALSEVHRVTDDGTTTPMLTDRKVMYLGAGDDRIVLYDCKNDRVVRLPAGDVLVASA